MSLVFLRTKIALHCNLYAVSSVLCKLAQYYYTKIRQLLMVFVEVFLLELSELRQITSMQRIFKTLHKTATQPLFPQTL